MSVKSLVPFALPADPTQPLEAATKQYVDGLVANLGPLRQTVLPSAATSYTLVLTDENKLLTFSASTAIAVTVPLNSSVAFAVGARIDLAQLGAGQITVVATAGVTIRATPSLLFRAQGSAASLIKVAASDLWLLTGDLA